MVAARTNNIVDRDDRSVIHGVKTDARRED
jgi:hypothetical protein